jgi:hypothetical protein
MIQLHPVSTKSSSGPCFPAPRSSRLLRPSGTDLSRMFKSGLAPRLRAVLLSNPGDTLAAPSQRILPPSHQQSIWRSGALVR